MAPTTPPDVANKFAQQSRSTRKQLRRDLADMPYWQGRHAIAEGLESPISEHLWSMVLYELLVMIRHVSPELAVQLTVSADVRNRELSRLTASGTRPHGEGATRRRASPRAVIRSSTRGPGAPSGRAGGRPRARRVDAAVQTAGLEPNANPSVRAASVHGRRAFHPVRTAVFHVLGPSPIGVQGGLSTWPTQSTTRPSRACSAFCDHLIDKGYATDTAITPWKNAIRKVFEIMGDDTGHAVDVTSVDLDDLLERFHVKARGTLKDSSRNAYARRVRHAVEAYSFFLENNRPPTFRKRGPRSKPEAPANMPNGQAAEVTKLSRGRPTARPRGRSSTSRSRCGPGRWRTCTSQRPA